MVHLKELLWKDVMQQHWKLVVALIMYHIDEKDEVDGMMFVAYRWYLDFYVLCLEKYPFRSKRKYVMSSMTRVYLTLRLYVSMSISIVVF
jgi:hypothetical protein